MYEDWTKIEPIFQTKFTIALQYNLEWHLYPALQNYMKGLKDSLWCLSWSRFSQESRHACSASVIHMGIISMKPVMMGSLWGYKGDSGEGPSTAAICCVWDGIQKYEPSNLLRSISSLHLIMSEVEIKKYILQVMNRVVPDLWFYFIHITHGLPVAVADWQSIIVGFTSTILVIRLHKQNNRMKSI